MQLKLGMPNLALFVAAVREKTVKPTKLGMPNFCKLVLQTAFAKGMKYKVLCTMNLKVHFIPAVSFSLLCKRNACKHALTAFAAV